MITYLLSVLGSVIGLIFLMLLVGARWLLEMHERFPGTRASRPVATLSIIGSLVTRPVSPPAHPAPPLAPASAHARDMVRT